MIKNIVFDLGNVLAKFNPYEIYYSYTDNKQQALELYELMYESNLWVDLDRGIDPVEVITNMCAKAPTHYHEPIQQIVLTWINALTFDPKMKSLVKQLKQHEFRIYMLSNISKQFYDFRKNNDIFDEFDGLYVSADYNHIKPSQEIYHHFLKNFDINAFESIFIDDKEENILSAKAIGFHVYHYQDDFNQLIKYLNQSLSISLEIK